MLHTGAYKINKYTWTGTFGQILGKKRLIAKTGAGQHGIASGVVGAMLSIPTESLYGY